MTTKLPLTISKTSFLTGTQCAKLLWMKLHERDTFPPVSEQQQVIFDQGHEIGAMAMGLCHDPDLQEQVFLLYQVILDVLKTPLSYAI